MTLDGELRATTADGAVTFVFVVRNIASDPIELTFTSGQVADVVVSDAEGEVWRYSEGRVFAQVLQTKTLAPNEAFTHELVWEEPSPGAYTAEASLAVTDATLVRRVEFEVR